jgi:hypothetical protein
VGESKETSLNRENFIKDAKVGFEIKTKKIQTQGIEPVELQDRDRNNIISAKPDLIGRNFLKNTCKTREEVYYANF